VRQSLRDARRDLAVLYARAPRLKRLSPAPGLVSEIRIEPRQVVAAGKPVIRLEDPRKVTARVLVNERDGDRVQPGQPAWIQVGGSGFAGKVTRVTPGVDRELWQAWVTIRPTRTPSAFRDGQPASIRIVTDRYRDALILPRSAVHDWRSGTVVYVANDGRAEERPVRAVDLPTGEMAVLEGLGETESVVLHARTVQIGQRIRPRPVTG
jgi:multidrug efflux pump subunit AcrA (membrane-fusion protein)